MCVLGGRPGVAAALRRRLRLVGGCVCVGGGGACVLACGPGPCRGSRGARSPVPPKPKPKPSRAQDSGAPPGPSCMIAEKTSFTSTPWALAISSSRSPAARRLARSLGVSLSTAAAASSTAAFAPACLVSAARIAAPCAFVSAPSETA